jgi:hypothetical protein
MCRETSIAVNSAAVNAWLRVLNRRVSWPPPGPGRRPGSAAADLSSDLQAVAGQARPVSAPRSEHADARRSRQATTTRSYDENQPNCDRVETACQVGCERLCAIRVGDFHPERDDDRHAMRSATRGASSTSRRSSLRCWPLPTGLWVPPRTSDGARRSRCDWMPARALPGLLAPRVLPAAEHREVAAGIPSARIAADFDRDAHEVADLRHRLIRLVEQRESAEVAGR